MKKQTAVRWFFNQMIYSKDLYDNEGYATQDKVMKLLEQAELMEEHQIKDGWNDGWKTATFNKCDWSENAYYESIKPNECKHGLYTCNNTDMCDSCDEGENYEI